jgi:xanthine dehydrogenase accessory factor
MLLQEGETIQKTNTALPLQKIILQDAAIAMQEQQSFFKNYSHPPIHCTAFIEYIKPPISLVIIGAGNDVVPLVDMAAIMGWDVTVVDGRSNYTKPERFTTSCTVILSKPENLLQKISIDSQTAFVLITHNYHYDMAMLGELLKKEVHYIGVLGPKSKLDRMLKELQQNGISITAEQLSVIYGPVGMEIGAETPEEIALAILAEIKAVMAGKNTYSLRNKTTVIHPRVETAIQEVTIK